MHRRVIFTASVVMFAMVAALALLVTTARDRTLPANLGANSYASFDFSRASLEFRQQATEQFANYADRSGIQLYRILPDRSGASGTERLIVQLSSHPSLPSSIPVLADQPLRTASLSAAEHSVPDGVYLIRAQPDQLLAFASWLAQAQIDGDIHTETPLSVLWSLGGVGSVVLAELGTIALVATLGLYWVSVRGRGRAIRLLEGCSGLRIGLEDGWIFISTATGAALLVAVASAALIAVTGQTAYLDYLMMVFAELAAAILVIAVMLITVISILTRPRVATLVERRPVPPGTRLVSAMLKIAMIAAVLFATPMTVSTVQAARSAEAQLAMWNRLSDRVSLVLYGSANDEQSYQRTSAELTRMLTKEARTLAPAVSYTFTGFAIPPQYSTLALVDRSWVDTVSSFSSLRDVDPATLPAGELADLREQLALLLADSPTGVDLCPTCSVRLMTTDHPIPLLLGGRAGAIEAFSHPLLVVATDSTTLSGSSLAAMASTGNLTLRGLGETRAALASYGLAAALNVQQVAQSQQLQARYARYFAITQAVASLGMLIAMIISIVISCYAGALSAARRDYPLRLAGNSWWRAAAPRISIDLMATGILAVLAVAGVAEDPLQRVAVAGSAFLAVAVLLLTHRTANQSAFTSARDRRL